MMSLFKNYRIQRCDTLRVVPLMFAPMLLSLGYTVTVSAQTSSATDLGIMTPHRTAADTGRMAWGHQDFTHYTTADLCDRSVANVTREVWRTRALDTLSYHLASDTLPTAAVAVARACVSVAHRNVTTTPLSALWSVLRLSLALGDTVGARQVVDRQLAQASTPADQGEILLLAIETYLNAHPPQVVPARALLKRLDALGAVARVAQFHAHAALLQYWHLIYAVDTLRREADAQEVRFRAMTSDERDAVEPYDLLFTLLNLADDVNDLAGERALLARWLTDFGDWHEGQLALGLAQVDQLVQVRTALYGQRTRPLAGQYWYGTNGKAHPTPGVVSLIVHIEHPCGNTCYSLYVVLKELSARYGTSLDLTLITDLRGHAPGTGILTPVEEAAAVAHFYLDFWHLPVSLLVDVPAILKRPDGRIVYGSSPIGAMFGHWSIANTVLVDTAGKVRWLGRLQGQGDQRQLEAALERVIGASAVSPVNLPHH